MKGTGQSVRSGNVTVKKTGKKRRQTKSSQLVSAPKQRRESPPAETKTFVIGIGASAGGLEALRTFLADLSGTGGAAFVVVQHMAPKYPSMLAELLSRGAQISVEELVDGTKPVPNTIYVTPPNNDVVMKDGELLLVEAPERIAPKPSIDRFFTCLADELGESCGGIILSGTGSDGTQGVRAIKAAGGFVIAQTPETAKYDGMPRSAINTGLVDLVLTPKEIALQIGSIVNHLADDKSIEPVEYSEEPFDAIMEVLKRHSRVDFAQYKPNTLKRRLERRLKANRIDKVQDYFEMLKSDETEVARLFQDVLISVTAFFRDGEQYQALREALGRYLTDRPDNGTLRIWSAGCSTGEEPYSIAIIINELMRDLQVSVDVQIFATDINEEAMAVARRGLYSFTSIEEMPTELLDRYFDRLEGGFQIKKNIRERVVFARHDVTRDPPFLKMDLVCCRNVFIYFESALQDKVIKVFHYALKPHGFLFLGKSESIGATKSFFVTVDNNAKIFQRNSRPSDPSVSFSSLQLERSEKKAINDVPRLRDVQEHIQSVIKSFAPHSIVVDEDMIVREIYGNAAKFLQFPEGSQNLNIDKLLSDELKNKVLTVLHRAKRSGEICVGSHFVYEKNSDKELVQAKVYPLKEAGDTQRLVVSFEFSAGPSEDPKIMGGKKSSSREIAELERELSATREHLQTVIEEQETTNEELQALNEELHSANEELQSTNEELETSNEELQSTNEELTTLNEELNIKSGELLDLNNYMATVHDAIQYPILVVDKNLILVRFNTCAERMFRLWASHRGKNVRLVPIADSLEPAFQAVERALKENEQRVVQVRNNEHDFEVKCDPFFNHKDELEGVVVSFVDNTSLYKALRASESQEKRLTAIFENIPAAVSLKNTLGLYTFVNRRFCERLKLQAKDILGKSDDQLFDAQLGRSLREKDLKVLTSRTTSFGEDEYFEEGRRIVLQSSRFPLFGADSTVEKVCTVSFDATPAIEARERLELFKETISASKEGILIFEKQPEGNYIATFASRHVERLMGIATSGIMGLSFEDTIARLFTKVDGHEIERFIERSLNGQSPIIDVSKEVDGTDSCFEVRSTIVVPPGERAVSEISVFIIDVTERRASEELLRKKQEEVLKAAKLASLGEMAAGIAHELNTPLTTIQGYVDLVRAVYENGAYDVQTTSTALDKIETTIQNISEIIVGLRSFAKVEKNTAIAQFDLAEVIDEVLRICDLNLRNKGVKVEVNADRKEFKLVGRRTQILQVFVNLINNAIEAVKPLQEKWIKINLCERDNAFLVQVIDSGPGIPEKIAGMIMMPFFTTKDEGTGLGLSLSRSIVKAHGGDLKVNSSIGNTCFDVVLPKDNKIAKTPL
jgi:two-component system, chemotaxis family, CheB/CheR fusion protein